APSYALFRCVPPTRHDGRAPPMVDRRHVPRRHCPVAEPQLVGRPPADGSPGGSRPARCPHALHRRPHCRPTAMPLPVLARSSALLTGSPVPSIGVPIARRRAVPWGLWTEGHSGDGAPPLSYRGERVYTGRTTSSGSGNPRASSPREGLVEREYPGRLPRMHACYPIPVKVTTAPPMGRRCCVRSIASFPARLIRTGAAASLR